MDHYLTIGLIGGVLAIDDRAGWQGLAAQPVFASLIIGCLFGEIATALVVGLFLELVWLAVLPMRGTRRPDQAAGAIVGSASSCYLIRELGDPRFAFVVALGVLVGLIAGEVAARLTMPAQKLKERRLGRVSQLKDFEEWKPLKRLFWIHALAIGYTFMVEAILVLLLLTTAYAASAWVSSEAGELVVRSIERWGLMFPAFGVASVIHVYWHRHLTRFLIASTVFVLTLIWIM